ncbi:His-Xaa-Ser system radical SAM maturase HxsB [Micavibrio aeruginosavorus]|uniref:Arylsulfatase regulator (Fe-S oxidoreductase) n=1 Tax=Micavibrio aeruginosavorus EPB TaxID=349215 RepID=M4VE86_9BACT|nr:His-Xaa-Ser system radical SAM maturase HxsB [Micavibrio aeruginosavorus]AGH97687.1 Arylsulfatase regulator (Fe-S oxidoreductase) [Micavibrio aeruginosavorus EPB]
MAKVAFNNFDSYCDNGEYQILPFRFARIPKIENILIVSEVGEYHFLPEEDLRLFVDGNLKNNTALYDTLKSKHFLLSEGENVALRLVSAKYRTRKSHLRHGPALHIFVVSLRCDHSCPYCQVSRQSTDKSRFDMSDEIAIAAIDRMFEAPAKEITVEFQGGEPLLAFDRIKFIVESVIKKNERYKKNVVFSITSTLHFLTDEILSFFKEHNFQVSTSIDGPEDLHNLNRVKREKDSYAKTISMLQKARDVLGVENIAALTTLTRESLKDPKAIIDEYVRLGFRSIFLRPLSPYGFAVKSARKIGYDVSEFLKFYTDALRYIIEINKNGTIIEEAYTAILLTHILTPFPTGYVDLRSPTGSGLGVIVYNYDGSVHASDESRMLSEMGDNTFKLGSVFDSYSDLIQSDAMKILLATGVSESLPGCSDCAFLPYCGADPVFHVARHKDPVGHRAFSDHCVKHTHIFNTLFEYIYENDRQTMDIFLSWVTKQSVLDLNGNKGGDACSL